MNSDLPDAFKNEPPYIQNRVCGELMGNMARLSADLYRTTGRAQMKEAAVKAGTRAMVFVKANASLSDEERARAKQIADSLEKRATPDKPVIAPYKFCEERAQRWAKEGVVTPMDIRLTEDEVREALEKSVSAKGR